MSDRAMNYMLRASNGKMIRTATKVIFADGHEICFTERMSKQDAIRQANDLRAREAAA